MHGHHARMTEPTPTPTAPKPLKLPLRQRVPRLSGWALITICLMAGIWALAPQQLPVSLYKLSLVTLAAVVGYWLDRSLFPYARPDTFMGSDLLPEPPDEPAPHWCMDDEQVHLMHLHPWAQDTPAQSLLAAAAMLRRALIVGAAMLAMGLGA